MPKRKNAPKMPPASVEDRRERNLRVVHREEMSTTIGDVLEHEHTDAAIELLYAQDNLAAGRDLNDPAALGIVDTAAEGVDAAKVEDTRPVDSAPPATDHAKSGTVVDNIVAGVVTEAGAVVSEASAAATAVKAAASRIADTVVHAVSDAQSAARDRAHEENVAEARAQRRAADVAEATAVDADEGKPLSTPRTDLLRFLSPRFVVGATKQAVGEIVDGIREARSTLVKAGERARAAFGPIRS